METFETSDFSTGLKYATMTVPEGGSPLYACTQGYPDLHVRVASLDGELDFSPLHSDLYQEIGKTSDVTLASEGSLVVMVWEEEWIGMGPGISDNLVFRISHDGGVNWSSPKTIHEGGTSPGGDPSVSISNGDVYLVYQRPVKSGGGEIWAARMVAGDTCFRLFGDFGGSVPGWVGPGWLPNIDAQSGAIAISWEHSNLSYFSKDDHRMGVFVVKNAASSLPTVLELEDTSAPTDDSSLYDLVAHVQLGEDLSFVDVFWVRAEWGQGQQVLLTLYHRNDSLY